MVSAEMQQQLFTVPEDSAFAGAAYRAAPEPAAIASTLIDRHGFLGELRDCKIGFEWRRKTGRPKGRPKVGQLRRCSDLLGYYTGRDFVIWLAADTTREGGFDDRAVEWAVFHQLCRIGVDEKGNFITVEPELVAFQAEIKLYADVSEDLRLARRSYVAAEQLGLFDVGPVDGDDDTDDEWLASDDA